MAKDYMQYSEPRTRPETPRLVTPWDDLLTDERGELITSVAGWEAKRSRVLGAIHDAMGEGPTEKPEPDLQWLGEEDCGAYVRHTVRYAVHPDETVPADICIPKRADGPLPAVLCLHQTVAQGRREALGQEGDPMLAYAADLAELGFVTLSPDHFCAGERTPPEGAYVTHRFYQRFPEWSAVGKNLWETRIAIDVLGSLEQVDGGRIGCMGHSLGGSGTVFTAAFDERVTCAVCNCGLNNFRCNPMRIKWARDGWYIYLPSLRPLFLAEEPPPFDWHELAACIAPRAFLDVSALHDRCLEGSQHVPGMLMRVQEVYDLHEAGERCASFFHNAGHGMSRATRAAAYAWLEQWLAAGYA